MMLSHAHQKPPEWSSHLITRLTFGSQEGTGLIWAIVGISSMVFGVVGFFMVRKRREIWRRKHP